MNLTVTDPLEPIGILAGVLLIVVGIGTLVTAPWTHSASALVPILRILGTIATIFVGVALLYVVRLDG